MEGERKKKIAILLREAWWKNSSGEREVGRKRDEGSREKVYRNLNDVVTTNNTGTQRKYLVKYKAVPHNFKSLKF